MRGRTLLTLGLVLLVSACQPPTYRIIAHHQNYRLFFTARGSGSWPLRADEGIAADRLTVRDGSRYLWAIEREDGKTRCQRAVRSPPFPVYYAASVPCYRTLVEAQPLAPGTLYRVQGSGIRMGSGYFRIEALIGGGRAINLDWDDVEAEVRGWSQLPDPPGADQVNSNTSAAPAAAETNAVRANAP